MAVVNDDSTTAGSLYNQAGECHRMTDKERDELINSYNDLYWEKLNQSNELFFVTKERNTYRAAAIVMAVLFALAALVGCKYTVTWKDDHTREDGSLLYPAQIAGYEIKHKCGSVESEPVPTEKPATIYCSSDLHQIYVRTIDADDRASKWSDGSYTLR